MPNLLEISSLETYSTPIALGGGTQSTYKITSANGPPLVLKFGASPEALRVEMLCNATYAELGVRVPQSTLFQQIPAKLAAELNLPENTPVQVSEFIESDKVQDEVAIQAYAKEHFSALALLGNIDCSKCDNFIQSKGKVYLIDAGSNFLFRSLGEERTAEAEVTEFERLRSFNKNKSEWFGDLSNQELEAQAAHLLEMEHALEQPIWDLSNQLGLSTPVRMQFLQGLSDRFDHMAQTYGRAVERYPNLDRKVRLKKTAAGVFTYTLINKEPHILIAKRRGSGEWDCFGGSGDETDNTLHMTAAREVFEESSKKIRHIPAALFSAPSHDFITEKNGEPFTYRLYIREHSYVEPSAFSDPEHSEYRWVKLDDFKYALNRAEINADGKPEIKVYRREKDIYQREITVMDRMRIYPEFYHLLQQDAVKAQIDHIIKKKKPRKTHTQSVFKQNTAQKKPLRHFHSPQTIQAQYTTALVNHLKTMAQIKQMALGSAGKKSVKNKGEETQTELHMRGILGQDYVEGGSTDALSQNVGQMIKRTEGLPQHVDHAQLKKICINFIELEQKGGPQRRYAYHACPREVAFAYDIYSAMYKILQADTNKRVFRANNIYAKPFLHINQFIANYMKGSRVHNNSENYNEVAISANGALFGSHNNSNSCSLFYFLTNYSARPVDLKSLLKSVFPFDLSDIYIEELLSLLAQCYPEQGIGVLYQSSMDTEDFDANAYMARSGGDLYAYDGTFVPGEVFVKLTNDLNSHDPDRIAKATEYLTFMQMRVMVAPHLDYDINKATAFDLNNKKTDAKIDGKTAIIPMIVAELLSHLSADTLHGHVPGMRLLTAHAEQNKMSAIPPISINAIKTAIERDDIQTVLSAIVQFQSLAEYAFVLCDELNKFDFARQVIDACPAVKTTKIKPLAAYSVKYLNKAYVTDDVEPLFVINILARRADLPQRMKLYFGENWHATLPMQGIEDEEILLRLIGALDPPFRLPFLGLIKPKLLELLKNSNDPHALLEKIINAIPKDQHYAFLISIIVHLKDYYHLNRRTEKNIFDVVALIPDIDPLTFLNQVDSLDNILQKARYPSEKLIKILASIAEDQRYDFLMKIGAFLKEHYFVSGSDHYGLLNILELIPQANRLSLFNQIAVPNHASYARFITNIYAYCVLKLLSTEDRSTLFDAIKDSDYFIEHLYGNLLLEETLKYLSPEHKVELLDRYIDVVIHHLSFPGSCGFDVVLNRFITSLSGLPTDIKINKIKAIEKFIKRNPSLIMEIATALTPEDHDAYIAALKEMKMNLPGAKEIFDAICEQGRKGFWGGGAQKSNPDFMPMLIFFAAEVSAYFNETPSAVVSLLNECRGSVHFAQTLHFFKEEIKTYFRANPSAFSSFYKKLEFSEQVELITVIGPDLTHIVNSCSADEKNELMKTKHITRSLKYHQHPPAYQRTEQAVIPFIKDLFNQIVGVNKYKNLHFFTTGDSIAVEIITLCDKPDTTPSAMLFFLREKLAGIDEQDKPAPSYSLHSTPKSDGGTAMRLLYCIEQLETEIHTPDCQLKAQRPSGPVYCA